MIKKTGLLCFIIGCCMFPNMAWSQIKFPAIIGDNMVLQQKFNVPFWGWCSPGKMVTIIPGWNNKKITTLAKPDGKWMVNLETPAAGGPYWIKVNDTVLINVLIGEVWFCSGQSNMEWPLKKAQNPDQEIATSANPQIRLFTVARLFADEPRQNCYGRWLACSPENSKDFSAVAYYYGKELNAVLKVPVGLINSSWGGTPAEAWTSNEVLERNKNLSIYLERFKMKCAKSKPGIAPLDQYAPSALYNSMVAPVAPFAIKGAIWYQGESNTPEPERYEILFPAMIKDWRDAWGKGDFPFYFVQIAPYNYDVPLCAGALRDAQRKTLALKNTGMVVTLDIGNPKDIHPVNKMDVGRRLAFWALAKDYEQQNIVYSGPLYNKMSIENNRIRIEFNHVSNGLVAKDGLLRDFEIANKDEMFIPANAVIEGNSVIVSASTLKDPVAVRYAFNNTSEASLFNGDGLPASTFRTDNWPINVEETEVHGRFDTTSREIVVTMNSRLNPGIIHYDLEGNEPNRHSDTYEEPLRLKRSAKIMASSFYGEIPSSSIASLDLNYHLGCGKPVKLETPCNEKYGASGNTTLVDGILGSDNFGDGSWLGFHSSDLDVTINLLKKKQIKRVSAGFLKAPDSWIFTPTQIEVFTSLNGIDFVSVGIIQQEQVILNENKKRVDFSLNLNETKTQYIRVKAKGVKICPEGHPGEGEKAWLFADEIVIE